MIRTKNIIDFFSVLLFNFSMFKLLAIWYLNEAIFCDFIIENGGKLEIP